MKKVLFASTALVAGALAAPQFASAQSVSAGNADITFGGYARFGLLYVDPDGAEDFTDITSRYRLQIDASTESDAGVTFGARVRIQQDNDGSADGVRSEAEDADGDGDTDYRGRQETGINGVRFFARAGGLEVGVGNIFGALESMPGQYPIDIGLTGHNYDYTAYNFGGDAYDSDSNGAAGLNGVEVIYSAGDFAVHVSASDANDRVAGYAAYTFSGFTAALGLQDSDSDFDTEWTATIGGDIGPANVTLAYADNNDNGEQWVLAGRFDVGASTNVEAYFADRSGANDVEESDGDSYGVDFNHDMGGGTSLRGGITKNFEDSTLVDFGVRFNF